MLNCGGGVVGRGFSCVFCLIIPFFQWKGIPILDLWFQKQRRIIKSSGISVSIQVTENAVALVHIKRPVLSSKLR